MGRAKESQKSSTASSFGPFLADMWPFYEVKCLQEPHEGPMTTE